MPEIVERAWGSASVPVEQLVLAGKLIVGRVLAWCGMYGFFFPCSCCAFFHLRPLFLRIHSFAQQVSEEMNTCRSRGCVPFTANDECDGDDDNGHEMEKRRK